MVGFSRLGQDCRQQGYTWTRGTSKEVSRSVLKNVEICFGELKRFSIVSLIFVVFPTSGVQFRQRMAGHSERLVAKRRQCDRVPSQAKHKTRKLQEMGTFFSGLNCGDKWVLGGF